MAAGIGECDWCGDCAEDQPCRCCLAAEVDALRAQVQAVRDVADRWGGLEPFENADIAAIGIYRALDGGDA